MQYLQYIHDDYSVLHLSAMLIAEIDLTIILKIPDTDFNLVYVWGRSK
jgi:hypothetical protein